MAKPVKRTGTEQWRPYVEKWAPEFGVPVDIAMRVLRQESGGAHTTKGGRILTSSAGAMGLMQLMPGTARALGVDPHKPLENLRGGLKYLGQQYKRFGNWNHAVAAYNAGPGRLQKALRQGGDDNWRAYLPRETRNYENAIMGGKPYMGGSDVPVGTTPQVQSPAMHSGMPQMPESSPFGNYEDMHDPHLAGALDAASSVNSMIQSMLNPQLQTMRQG